MALPLRPAPTVVKNSLRSFLQVNQLEDRLTPAGVEYWLQLTGLTGVTTAAQMDETRVLLQNAGVPEKYVEVVDHLTTDGSIVVEVPEGTLLSTVVLELQTLPGFVSVVPFFDGEESGIQVSPDGGPIRTGPDQGANLAVGLVGNEPTVVVNPLNPLNVVTAQYNNGAQTMRISNDGGTTFPITRNAPLATGQTFFQGDDSLAFDSQGRLFWSYLSGGTPAGPNVSVVQVNSATGAIIGTPTLVATTNLDKQWLAADANPSSPFANNLYVAWHDFAQTNAPVRFARSTNQGVTWITLGGNLSGAGEGFTWPCETAVAPNGDVWVAWHTNTGQTNGEVRMRRSTDGGVTFGAEIIPFPTGTAATTTNGATGLANKITGLHVWLQGSMQPRILVDPARPGNIYVVSVDDPDTFSPTDDASDIVIARSTNNGASWTRNTISQGIYGDQEFMPAAAIDANGNIAVTWYDTRRHLTVADSQGGTHFLLDLYATTSLDGGVTFATPFRLNDTAYDPELGAPDRFGNHTLRTGEYNGLALASNGVAHAVWTGNTNTGQQVLYDKFAIAVGLTVTATTPAVGSVVTVPPTSFAVSVSSPINPLSLQASDFTVNGIAATGFSYISGSTTATFTYGASPVTVQGVQTIAVAAAAFTRASDGGPVAAFSGTFRYDAVLLAVVSTTPPTPNGVFTLPGPFTYDVTFNEAVAPGSVQTTDLTLSGIGGATVTGVTVLAGNTTVRFTISGITTEGAFAATIAAGAITDAFGNTGAAFTGTYQVDFGTVPYPTPLTAKSPAGSLVYDPTVGGLINFAGDIDSFTLAIDPNQTITVVVTPTAAGLQPRVELFDPSNVSMGFAQASAAGQITGIQTRFIATGGTYRIAVSGASSTVGGYTVQVILNAAFELEGPVVGASNNTSGTAQAIDGSFIALDTTLAHASRGAVLGTTDTAAGYTATAVAYGFADISNTGTFIVSGDDNVASQSIGFNFNFYGTTYNTLFVSTNGLITFNSGNGAFSNSTLAGSPAEATITPFWDDLYVYNADATVKYQVVGAVGSRQLIIQWTNVNFYGTSGSADTLTFQAILSEGSNAIRFNYLDLDSGGQSTQSANAGIKSANPTNGQYVEIVDNAAPNALIGTGKSTVFSPAVAAADFYKFDAAAGQRVSVALTNLAAGNVDVQLIAPDGVTVLANGVAGATNLNEAIQRFLIGATGTYYVRVTGDSTVPYSVVVTKDAVFDAEANDTRLTAQNISGTQGALGALVGGGSNTAIANAIDSGWWDNSGFHDDFNDNYFVGQSVPTQYRDFFVFDLTAVSQTVTGATLSLFNPSNGYSSPDASETYSVFDVSTSLPALRASNSGQVSIFSDLGTGTSYGSIVVTTASNGQTLTLNLNAAGLAALNAARGGLFALGGAITTPGSGTEYLYGFTSGTETRQLTLTLGLPEDWYAVTLAPGETILEVETRTPADGTGEFVNVLNPKIQLFDAANVDITGSVTILGDGRNEKVRVTGLTAGATYFLKVSSEGTTAGEYFVGVKALRTPTVTTKVDDALPIGVGPDGTFSVPNPVGNGWTNVTGSGYLNDYTVHADNVNEVVSNFANWTIKVTPDPVTGTFELFTSWVARPQNATNATYLVYEGTTLRATVTVNQKASPNDALFGTTLLKSLGTFQKLNPATAYFNVRLLTLGANGDVVADGVFDPPSDGVVRLAAPAADGSVAVVAPAAADAVVPVAPPARVRTADARQALAKSLGVSAASVSPWTVTAAGTTGSVRQSESKAKVLPPVSPASFAGTGVTVEAKRIAASSIAWESLTDGGLDRDLWTVAGTRPLRRSIRA